MATALQTSFTNAFSWIIEIVSLDLNWQIVSIGCDNALGRSNKPLSDPKVSQITDACMCHRPQWVFMFEHHVFLWYIWTHFKISLRMCQNLKHFCLENISKCVNSILIVNWPRFVPLCVITRPGELLNYVYNLSPELRTLFTFWRVFVVVWYWPVSFISFKITQPTLGQPYDRNHGNSLETVVTTATKLNKSKPRAYISWGILWSDGRPRCLRIMLAHYHHYADVSGDNELLNVCQVHSAECVSKIKSILSVIFNAIYGAVCVQLTHLSHDDCQNTCTLSYHHHQIASVTHLPLIRLRSWKNGMRCMSFCNILHTYMMYLQREPHYNTFFCRKILTISTQ